MILLFSPTRRTALGVAVAVVTASVLVSGCASRKPLASASPSAAITQAGDLQIKRQPRLFGVFSPYRPDVQQGNFISQEMVAQLRVGMTPDQVRFVLGTPLLMDMFHENRWDYPFRLQKGNGEITSSHVVVFFENNRVARFEGGDLPVEQDYLLRIAAPKK